MIGRFPSTFPRPEVQYLLLLIRLRTRQSPHIHFLKRSNGASNAAPYISQAKRASTHEKIQLRPNIELATAPRLLISHSSQLSARQRLIILRTLLVLDHDICASSSELTMQLRTTFQIHPRGTRENSILQQASALAAQPCDRIADLWCDFQPSKKRHHFSIDKAMVATWPSSYLLCVQASC